MRSLKSVQAGAVLRRHGLLEINMYNSRNIWDNSAKKTMIIYCKCGLYRSCGNGIRRFCSVTRSNLKNSEQSCKYSECGATVRSVLHGRVFFIQMSQIFII